ncbi:MAG TPA: cobalt-precorrin 5A hydrolase [Clostridium sp.]
MKISIISFTLKGSILGKKLKEELNIKGHCSNSFSIPKFASKLGLIKIEESLTEWTSKQFQKVEGIIFIGACGIAVRAIAPFVKDKKTDPAVVVIDEKGEFVIPILSGHIGGANDIAQEISRILKATAVITTATDVNNKFSVDIFATKENLYISDMKLVKRISSEILEDKIIGLSSDYKILTKIPVGIEETTTKELGICISIHDKSPFVNTLNLIPRIVTLGIGCRKNTTLEAIESLVLKVLNNNSISIKSIKNISSIDLKKNEEGILDFCEKYKLDFLTYTSEELNQVKGDYSESSFVKSITGVGNVCERSAVVGSNNGKLIINKNSENGVTVAIAVSDWSVSFE